MWMSSIRKILEERPKELQAVFDRDARKYNVYPIQTSTLERLDTAIRPSLTRGRTAFTYSPGMVRIPEGAAPDIKNKSFRLTAEVEIPEGGAQGMLVTQGGRFAGYGLYLLDGRPVFHYNLAGVGRYQVAGSDKLPVGKHTIVLDFKYDGGGIAKGGNATLIVDGQKAAAGRIERMLPFRLSLDETWTSARIPAPRSVRTTPIRCLSSSPAPSSKWSSTSVRKNSAPGSEKSRGSPEACGGH